MRDIIQTDKAPKALGPYSQGVKVTGKSMIFCSGQVAMDPKTGEVVGKTAPEQCKQVMENLREVLNAAGADFSRVAKTTMYLVDMNDFAAVNEVYAEYFGDAPPARAAVQVGRLPKDVRIEIEAIAIV